MYETHLRIGQSVNAVAESEERLVDVGSLPEPSAPILGYSCSLRPSQIDQRQLGYPHILRQGCGAVASPHKYLPSTCHHSIAKLPQIGKWTIAGTLRDI